MYDANRRRIKRYQFISPLPSHYLEAFPEWLAEVFCDLVDTNAAHGSYSKGPDEGVGVIAVLGKGVDRQDC